MENITGRKKELELFNTVINGYRSEFIALYGRRRVGKTFLVRTAFNNKFTFQLTGIANTGTRQQLANFNTALKKAAKKKNIPIAENWLAVFEQLITFLEKLPSGKKIFL